MYLAAFKHLKLKSTDCVIVEDAGHGIEAAKRSGGILCQVTGFNDVDYTRVKNFVASTEKGEK
jgi:beta-phosphoglucomutase-like phosphatase (HAD superfamily)